MNGNKPRILAFVDYYLPGFKGGGPVHSVSRLVQRLAADADFSVFTRDRDLGDVAPYTGVVPGTWMEWAGVRTYYAGPGQMNPRSILKAIRQVNPEIIYLNSYFSRLTRAVLLLRLLGKLPRIAILVAPRGEFSKGALSIKSAKKRAFLAVAGATGLHKGVTWQVSSVHELNDTRAVVHGEPHYFIKAPDVLLSVSEKVAVQRPRKVAGSARFAFISRIAPIKNLHFAIERLRDVKGDVVFTIYGPAEDHAYWARCEHAISELPENVRCEFAGPVQPAQVLSSLGGHHFFLFPTKGENFGHVISEALIAGCPVLLSDRTPWLDLDEHAAGWVIPLDEIDRWDATIETCIAMDEDRFSEMSNRAQEYIGQVAACPADLEQSRKMFTTALDQQVRDVA